MLEIAGKEDSRKKTLTTKQALFVCGKRKGCLKTRGVEEYKVEI